MENSPSRSKGAGGGKAAGNVNIGQPNTHGKADKIQKWTLQEYKTYKETGVRPHRVPQSTVKRGRNDAMEDNDPESNTVATSPSKKKKKVRFSIDGSEKEDLLRSNDTEKTAEINQDANTHKQCTTTDTEAMDIDQESVQIEDITKKPANPVSEVPKKIPDRTRKHVNIEDEPRQPGSKSTGKQKSSRNMERVPTMPYSGTDRTRDPSTGSQTNTQIKVEEEDSTTSWMQLPFAGQNLPAEPSEDTDSRHLMIKALSSVPLVSGWGLVLSTNSPINATALPQTMNQQLQIAQHSQLLPVYGLQKFIDSQRHLRTIYWTPLRKDSVPRTHAQMNEWIDPVAVALLSTTRAYDYDQHPRAFAKFCGENTVYSDRDIESIATTVILMAMNLLNHGTTNLYFKDPSNKPSGSDANLSFPERIKAFMKLVREFKKAADHVMSGQYCVEYLASPNANWYDLYQQHCEWHRLRTLERSHDRMQNELAVLRQRPAGRVSTNMRGSLDAGVGHTVPNTNRRTLSDGSLRQIAHPAQQALANSPANAISPTRPGVQGRKASM